MKIWLDDDTTINRQAPEGWVHITTGEEAIEFLGSGVVTHINLDHDLGEGRITGYDVAIWIEVQVYCHGFVAPEMEVHSCNPVGNKRIQQVIDSINRFKERDNYNGVQ